MHSTQTSNLITISLNSEFERTPSGIRKLQRILRLSMSGTIPKNIHDSFGCDITVIEDTVALKLYNGYVYKLKSEPESIPAIIANLVKEGMSYHVSLQSMAFWLSEKVSLSASGVYTKESTVLQWEGRQGFDHSEPACLASNTTATYITSKNDKVMNMIVTLDFLNRYGFPELNALKRILAGENAKVCSAIASVEDHLKKSELSRVDTSPLDSPKVLQMIDDFNYDADGVTMGLLICSTLEKIVESTLYLKLGNGNIAFRLVLDPALLTDYIIQKQSIKSIMCSPN